MPCSTAITIGMFDGVHKGHQLMLQELKTHAQNNDCKSAVITFANHPRNVLAEKLNKDKIQLLQTQEERFAKIAKSCVDYLICIDFTLEFAALSPKQFLDILIPKIHPKILLLGYDNSFGNPKNSDFKDITSKGYYKDIRIFQDKMGLYENGIEISSTEIRNAIVKGNITLANAMLGENYSICSVVEKGFQVGRNLGFPTANIAITEQKLIPKNGVYATKIEIGKKIYKGVTNVGYCPTFQRDNKTIETFIFDFNEEIYAENIRICFVDFLREEMQFANAEALKSQIGKDVLDAKKILD